MLGGQVANTEIIVAVIGSAGVVLVALIGVWGAHRKIGKQVTAIEYGINHVDEEPAEGEPHTLGQIVRQGFARNDRDHALLQGTLEAHNTTLRAHAAALDSHSDIDRRIEGKIDQHLLACDGKRA